ncbi:ATP-binding protein [Streptomyces bambusae]|uniref:AAA family ATPase n=1 Tax=Streptomyces bambusae TaxID=1550616 RepID=UPI001CFEE906|nr:AAA family ATPase [Streptomyces bambusae]MCB5167472.1 ATP-binding protein [Streptomyces bambusae]
MRIGVSGTHGTGKTTLVHELCALLPGHEAVEEPYLLLAEDGYDFADPPSVEDYRVQLETSLRLLRSSAGDVVFDRTPVDFLAYLAAHGRDVEDVVTAEALEPAMSGLDLLVVLPVTAATERDLPAADLPRLRAAVDAALLEIVREDPLDAWPDLPVLELAGPPAGRAEAVVRVAAGLP